MHALHPPRRYKTIFVCGAFGLGSTREQDVEALRRFHEYLEPDGTLLLDIEVPYADSKQWRYWLREERGALPEAPKPPRERRRASDVAEYALRSRIVELDPLSQRVTLAMHAEQWRDGLLQAELLLMLEHARFTNVIVEGDHNDREATSDDDFLVLVAKKR